MSTDHLIEFGKRPPGLSDRDEDGNVLYPYAYDGPWPTDICTACMVNLCGLCDWPSCPCEHGLAWPAPNPWAALWHFEGKAFA